jgi:hypothetical protein
MPSFWIVTLVISAGSRRVLAPTSIIFRAIVSNERVRGVAVNKVQQTQSLFKGSGPNLNFVCT